MADLKRSILEALAAGGADSASLAARLSVDSSAVMSAAESLEKDGLVGVRRADSRAAVVWLNAEGLGYFKAGTPERRLCDAVRKSGGLILDEAASLAGLSAAERGIALKWALNDKLLAFDKTKGNAFLVYVSDARTLTEKALDAVGENRPDERAIDPDFTSVLKSRRLLERKELPAVIGLSITEAGRASLGSIGGTASQLTPEMLKDGSWKKARFRPYDLATAAAPLAAGRRHRYYSFIRRMKDELASMGFREARGPLVELEFWNMDVLFMPQDHPARDIHDVFYLDARPGMIEAKALEEKVRKAHEGGLAGSRGWGYSWSPAKARRVIARSHDTGISARELFKHLKPPEKVFFITRVFRPDEIDWKHFIEFNQLGGYVAQKGMNFRELLGYLKDFATGVFGAEEVRFVPSFFPFTEPSVEMYAKVAGKWTEVGGAGMFRPEMLDALGVKVPVCAWGLGLDRLAMIKLGVSDLRQLFGTDIAALRSS